MVWEVRLTAKVKKNYLKLPGRIGKTFQLLLNEIELLGSSVSNWLNYGKLSENCYHCH